MTQFHNQNPFEVISEVVSALAKQAMENGNHPMVKDLHKNGPHVIGLDLGNLLNKMPEAIPVFELEDLKKMNSDDFTLEEIEAQIQFWTNMKELKLTKQKEQEVKQRKIEHLRSEIDKCEQELARLHAELPNLLVTDVNKAQEVFYEMASISNVIQKMKEELSKLEG